MRFLFLAGVLALTSCVHHGEPVPVDRTPLDVRLEQLAALQNSGHFDAMRTFFTKAASIQSPVTPQPASVERYLRTLKSAPYTVNFSQTKTLYSFPGRAMTQSEARLNAPRRFTLNGQVMVTWELEDGYWRIARMTFPDWPSIVGTWKRSGLRGEGSIELRILPGGEYLIYTEDGYSAPAFHGRYRLEGNKITLTDVSAFNASQFSPEEGSYLFVGTATGLKFRKISEANPWRAERFEGDWTAAW